MLHVYGKVAPLPWEDDLGVKYRDFNNNIITRNDENVISKLTNNIRIIYDERKKEATTRIGKILAEAKKIFFLGFGYADENLDVLNILDTFNEKQQIYGTALGLTEKEIRKIKIKFTKNSKVYSIFINEHRHVSTDKDSIINIEDINCLGLLRKYL
jgi:hypothetical protein